MSQILLSTVGKGRRELGDDFLTVGMSLHGFFGRLIWIWSLKDRVMSMHDIKSSTLHHQHSNKDLHFDWWYSYQESELFDLSVRYACRKRLVCSFLTVILPPASASTPIIPPIQYRRSFRSILRCFWCRCRFICMAIKTLSLTRHRHPSAALTGISSTVAEDMRLFFSPAWRHI